MNVGESAGIYTSIENTSKMQCNVGIVIEKNGEIQETSVKNDRNKRQECRDRSV